MKLKFKDQSFQTDAVNAVADLFNGQEKFSSTFSIIEERQINLHKEYGIGNALQISVESLLANMQEVQKKNALPKTNSLENNQFCVEMETGTGKTYVYTKTIFELNKRYGFTKFIVVVPSVAIREGVYKSFQITEEHFGLMYDNVPYRYFIYNSAKLSDVRQFATSSNIEIMIINIDAFKKAENIINQQQDRLNGETAMRYIQDTNSIVIIDEPQSVDNTKKAKEAIASLNPLCVFRYSATHREKINLLYRLTPVDAYQMGLVKQICVSSNTIENDFNKPYVRLLSVSMDNEFSAKIEIDVRGKDNKVSRKTFTVKQDTDLFILSGERDLYEGYIIENIDCTLGRERIDFTNTEFVPLGKAIGSVDENLIKRAQIRRTIEAHFDKELMYYDKGIKVLSLFFIDEVAKYRTVEGGKGIYALMFEECYNELLNREKYAVLRDRFNTAVNKAHNGYFSQDKKGNYKDTKGDTLDDYNTYNTIMKDKEWLLSFDCPLRFIFSHSALKEGWDNPNVFQVCTLIEQKSTFTARQKVGRGLRLCVNQDGERIEDKNINLLHVMANESFAEFADTLQKEIEQETGVKFGVLQISLFSGMVYSETKEVEKTVTAEQAINVVDVLKANRIITENGNISVDIKPEEIELPPELEEVKPIIASIIENEKPIEIENLTGLTYKTKVTEEKTVTYEEAAELIEHFEKKEYITKSGKIKDTMKNDLLNGTLDLPQKYEAARERFENIISKADRKPQFRDASKDVVVRLKNQVIAESPYFKELWERIKQKTTYRVKIDTKLLVERAVKLLRELPQTPKARIISQTADIDIRESGVAHFERELRTVDIKNDYSNLPDIITIIAEETHTTWETALEIIEQSGRVIDFIRNPQLFIESIVEIIQDVRHELAIDGIQYIKLDGQQYYAQQIFDSTELLANLDKNAVAVNNSVYDYTVYDSSTIEKPFAIALDHDPDVKMFFKLPERFKINTPIGTYNPDWAVYLDCDGEEKLYFVLETKGSTSMIDLRTKEQLKIHCGKRHFEALNDVELRVARDWHSFKVGR
ncbi:MAG: DEAD/DEAH box helicase family protein [Oscillospiraceae bacterium]|jgi:type III restriction enzyme|nr:DEAD/DEAH box helicase family protein [Oscillospiraceae bacterium]